MAAMAALAASATSARARPEGGTPVTDPQFADRSAEAPFVVTGLLPRRSRAANTGRPARRA